MCVLYGMYAMCVRVRGGTAKNPEGLLSYNVTTNNNRV